MTDKLRKPNGLTEARALLGSPELERMLQSQLVLIAFSDNASAAIRAIEMLVNMPREVDDSALAGVDTAMLELALRRAEAFIFGLGDEVDHG